MLNKNNLAELLKKERQEIDKIDRELVKLFEARMNVVNKIGDKKKAAGLPTLDASREAIVLEKVASYLENPEYKPYLQEFYKNLMTSSREYQEEKNNKITTP